MRLILSSLALCAALSAQTNLLANPGFEGGLTGWGAFGNFFYEPANAPRFVPLAGNGVASTFGNFSGGFNVSGAFQSFPAAPGDVFALDGWTRHFGGDPMVGPGLPNANWLVFKIAFFNANGAEIGAGESVALDGTFPTDTWIDVPETRATAPAGTVSVQALVLYLQPNFDGGAAHIDEMSFTKVWSLSASQAGITGNLTLDLSGGDPLQILGRFVSLDPANGTAPQVGNFFGMHIDAATWQLQLSLALASDPIFGGTLDAVGRSSLVVPGSALLPLSGVQLWFMGLTVSGPSVLSTPVVGLTLL